MQAVRVLGIERQCLLASELRLERPAGLQLAKACGMERGRFQCRRGVAGVPALAGVHQCMSNGVSGESVDDSCLCGKTQVPRRKRSCVCANRVFRLRRTTQNNIEIRRAHAIGFDVSYAVPQMIFDALFRS
jgi:hypothetical protein